MADEKELEKIFMVGWACKCAGHVFVDDSSVAGIKETIAEAEQTLKHGMSLVIFPEGSRKLGRKNDSLQTRGIHACRRIQVACSAGDYRRKLQGDASVHL